MSAKSDKREAATLNLDIHVVIKELWDGSWITFPVADPSLVSWGPAGESLQEQSAFLGAWLARVPPDQIERFCLPAEVDLREVDVIIPRDDLPHRLQIATPLSLACALIPAGRDTWVVILPLRHTFYVAQREDLDAAIRAEAVRVAAAGELSPQDWMDLLPPRSWSLRTITAQVERQDHGGGGRASSLRRELEDKKRRKEAAEILTSIGRPLHAGAASKPAPALVGRQKAMSVLTPLLEGADRLGVALVGPSQAGKSALLAGWLRAARAGGGAPLAFATSGAQLIAGMSGMGQWQARLRRVLEAAELLDAVLVFEDLGDLFGDQADGQVDMAGAIKPFLEEGRVRLVGELTPEALDLFEGRHVGFFGCLHRVTLEALSADEAAEALRARIAWSHAHEPQRPNLALDAVAPLIELVERYLPYQAFPGKAIRLYEDLRGICERRLAPEGSWPPIDAAQVFEAFSVQSGIPAFLLRQDAPLRQEVIEERLRRELIGQHDAIQRVAQTLCVIKARLQPASKPLATFLFIGPTGVGKTELARALSRLLFGSDRRLLRFDMSEFMDAEAADRLIQGVGSDEGLLTRRVRQQPFCVVLLDEIEKAHPAVFDLLLQVCGEGRLTDARGRTAWFHNAIIIMTSNLGAGHRRPAIGMGRAQVSDADHYEAQVQGHFRPEFVGRLDRIIAFAALDRAEILDVARMATRKLRDRRGFIEAGVELEVSDKALERLAEGGYDPVYGARALRRHLDARLVNPAARLMGRLGAAARQGMVRVSVEGEPEAPRGQLLASDVIEGLAFEVTRGRGRSARQDLRGALSISAVRRHVGDSFSLDTVERVRERLDFLVAQLSAGQGGATERRTARDLQLLQAEHHRLDALWEKIAALREEIEMLDEIAQTALLEGADPSDFLPDAEAAFARFRLGLLGVLMAVEPHRDQICLIAQEPDRHRALDQWLRPLLDDLHRRGWAVEIHIDGDQPAPFEEWHAGCRWGPARSPDAIRSWLGQPERKSRNLLLRASGPLAGALLALEAGLQRWPGPQDSEPAWLRGFCASPRIDLTPKEWLDPGLLPPAPPNLNELSSHKAVRAFKDGELIIDIGARKRRLPLDTRRYWEHFETTALEHLMLYEGHGERDRLILFEDRLKKTPEEAP